MKRVLHLGLLLSVCVFAGAVNSTLAQHQMPTGEQIARSAKSAKLNPAASTTAEKNGMRATVTPVDLSKVNTKILEKGLVVAVVDTKGVTDLPDGKYNLFIVKSNEGWHELFESGGKIFKRVKVEVEVNSNESGARKKSSQTIELTSGCFCVSICSGGIHSQHFCMMCPRCE